MRQFLIAISTICALAGCARRTALEAAIQADGAVMIDGASLSDQQVLDRAVAKYRRRGAFPVAIRADGSVPQRRFQDVCDIFRRAGVYEISTGSSERNSPVLLYPTFHTWTNEWKWDGLFVDEGQAIQTNAGVNVRLRGDAVLIDGHTVLQDDLDSQLGGLTGTDRNRVLLTADPETPHARLMATLKACENHRLDVTFREDWETKPAPDRTSKRRNKPSKE